MGEIDFQVIFAAENSNKFQKTRFWKEKSVEVVVTLECLPFNPSRRNCDVPLVLLERSCKYTLQCHMLCPPYIVKVHTWANTIGHTSSLLKIKTL